MEHLKNFMAENSLTQEAFAVRSGLSRSYVAEIAAGTKMPGRNAIEKISKATDGRVPASAWFEPATGLNQISASGG